MPGPAARVADMTAHGGVIMPPGVPTVLIGGMPAATITGMHVCPMITVLVPHVGGPVLPPGVPTVLIGGLPATTVGDMATCVGPPDVIIPPGCPTVLIGTGGGGSGGGGGGAVQAATESAYAALVGEPGPEAEGPHWIEYQFKDSAGNPITGVQYEFSGVDGHAEKIKPLTKDGIVRRGGLPDEGECSVKILALSNARWSTDSAKVGDEVELTADVEGYEDGTPAVFEIWEKDIDGADDFIVQKKSQVENGKVKTEWEYEYHEDDGSGEGGNNSENTDADILADSSIVIDDEEMEEAEGKIIYGQNLDEEEIYEENQKKIYSSPEYYFVVKVGDCHVRSDLLEYKDYIEIKLEDENGNPIPDEKYIVYLANGEIRRGYLGANGYKKEENVPPCEWDVEFPNLPGVSEGDQYLS